MIPYTVRFWVVSLVEEAWPAVLTTKLLLLTVRLDPLTAKPLVAVAFWRLVAPLTVNAPPKYTFPEE